MKENRFIRITILLIPLLFLSSCYSPEGDDVETGVYTDKEIIYVSQASKKTDAMITQLDNGTLFSSLTDTQRTTLRQQLVDISLEYENILLDNSVETATLNTINSSLAAILSDYNITSASAEYSALTEISEINYSSLSITDPTLPDEEDVVLLNEPFETDDFVVARNWTNPVEAGSKEWEGSNSYKNVAIGAYNSGDASNIAWIISPQITLTNNGVMTAEIQAAYWKHDGLAVYASTDYDGADPTTATWTALSATIPTSGDSDFIKTGNVSLNAYSGSNLHIGFKYTGADADLDGDGDDETTTYRIKNLKVYQLD